MQLPLGNCGHFEQCDRAQRPWSSNGPLSAQETGGPGGFRPPSQVMVIYAYMCHYSVFRFVGTSPRLEGNRSSPAGNYLRQSTRRVPLTVGHRS